MTPAATREYHRLIANLTRIGTLNHVDPTLVVEASRVKGLIEHAYMEIADSTLTIESGNGTAMPHPSVGIINKLLMRLRGLWRDMGLVAEPGKHATPKAAGESVNRWKGLLDIAD
jgi:hypothetical protein